MADHRTSFTGLMSAPAGAGNPASPLEVLPTRSFVVSPADSAAFADLSGDFNPLHLDPIVARRLLFGSTVAHGVHVLMAGLDAILTGCHVTLRLSALRVIFLGPPIHGEPLAASCSQQPNGVLSLTIRQSGVALQSITATFLDADGSSDLAVPDRPVPRRQPLDLVLADAGERSGGVELALDRKLAHALLPALARCLPASQLAVLLASTRIVGMECPGLRSIYADLALTLAPPPAAGETHLAFRTLRADRRMSLIRLGIDGAGASGEITALFRPDPVAQPQAAALMQHVVAGEFAGQRALVIGGSRGLGETTAKLLAMGGAEVAITFARGQDDALRVAQDIVSRGGSCGCFQFDVTGPPAELEGRDLPDGFSPTHVYFFATPPIQLVKGRSFSDVRFRQYCDCYVGGLTRSLAAIDRLFAVNEAPLALLYPSTIFLDDMRTDAVEYIAAKAAGEAVCRLLARARKGLRVACPRLPVLRTDQTNSLRGAGRGADPVPVLLNVLRDIR